MSSILAAAQAVIDRTKSEQRTFPSLHWVQQQDRSPEALASDRAVAYAVNVTNTGSTDSDHVVLGFITPPGAGQNGVPLQNLFGFERVFVRAGHTKTVWLWPSLLDFTHVILHLSVASVVSRSLFRFRK